MFLIRSFRKIFRFTVSLLWLPVICVPSFIVHIGGWPAIKRVSKCTRIWGKVLCRIWGMKVVMHGKVDPDKMGGLLVSNHTGYLDILVHASLFPIRFAPKKEIRKWPFLGWYLGISRPIWVDRSSPKKSRELAQAFRDTMEHGIPLLVYPEGTSSDGGTILSFKSTPFEAVVGTNFPIHTLVTVYRPVKEDGSNLSWHGDQALMPHFWRILGYRKIVVDVYVLDPVYPGDMDRKELALKIRTMMYDKFIALRTGKK